MKNLVQLALNPFYSRPQFQNPTFENPVRSIFDVTKAFFFQIRLIPVSITSYFFRSFTTFLRYSSPDAGAKCSSSPSSISFSFTYLKKWKKTREIEYNFSVKLKWFVYIQCLRQKLILVIFVVKINGSHINKFVGLSVDLAP